MSKILIDSEVLQTVMEALDFGIRQLSRNYTDDYSKLAYAQRHLESAIEEAKGKKISIVEWNKNPEGIPKRKGCYLAKYQGEDAVKRVWMRGDPRCFVDIDYWADDLKFPSED